MLKSGTFSGSFGSCLFLLFFVLAAISPRLQARSPGQRGRKTSRTSAPTQPRGPLPLDPLTAEERKAAEQLALGDNRIKELLAGRYRLISVDLLFWKSEREESQSPTLPAQIDRYAEVLFRRQDDESGARAVVNLTRRAVVSTSHLESAQVPMIPEDINEAARLALENEELRRALGSDAEGFAAAARTPGVTGARYAIEGLRVFSGAENDPCLNHRCIRLMFRRGQDYLGQPIVLVDLTAHQTHIERRDQ